MMFQIFLLFVLQITLVDGAAMKAYAIVYQAAPIPTQQLQLQYLTTITFTQETLTSPVRIEGIIEKANVDKLNIGTKTMLGFHVHQWGILDNNCNGAGEHYNPSNVDHGAPWDQTRHVGDLGNVNVTTEKTIKFDFYDSVIQLKGPRSIIGRAIVLHQNTDDYGRGGTDDSKKTGGAGTRLACGVIGIGSDYSLSDSAAYRSVALMNVYQSLALTAAFIYFARFFV